MNGERLQWHPGFAETFKLEGKTDAEKLLIQKEYQLGSKPKEIDILAIKEDDRYQCQQDIMKIFRKHNIVEYKGPDESLSTNDYYKVLGYAFFYVGDAEHVLEINPDEITITFVCNHYPRELLKHLWQKYGIVEANAEAGVYYLDGSLFPVQIIINHELDPEKYLWLYSLRNNLCEEELLAVLKDYEDKKENRQYQSAMDLILRANQKLLERMMGMSQVLDELMAEKYREMQEIGEKKGIEQGEKLTLLSLIRKKLAKGKGITEIAEMLEMEVLAVQTLMQEL